jgi:DNA-binding cell septation regulator SpoVG
MAFRIITSCCLRVRFLRFIILSNNAYNIILRFLDSIVFIAMPSRKTANGEYKDVAHPINPDFRNELQEKILGEYEAGHVETDSSDAND